MNDIDEYYIGKEKYKAKYYLKYDEHDNLVYKKLPDGTEDHYEYKYDDRGNVVYEKLPDGIEYYYEY